MSSFTSLYNEIIAGSPYYRYLDKLDFRGSPNPYYRPKQSMRIKNKQNAKMRKLTKKK